MPRLTRADAYLGDLLTNAKKVTVSVLYWYEKLSDLTIEIFTMILKRIKSFFVFFSICYPRGAPVDRVRCNSVRAMQPRGVEQGGSAVGGKRAFACYLLDSGGGRGGSGPDEVCVSGWAWCQGWLELAP